MIKTGQFAYCSPWSKLSNVNCQNGSQVTPSHAFVTNTPSYPEYQRCEPTMRDEWVCPSICLIHNLRASGKAVCYVVRAYISHYCCYMCVEERVGEFVLKGRSLVHWYSRLRIAAAPTLTLRPSSLPPANARPVRYYSTRSCP